MEGSGLKKSGVNGRAAGRFGIVSAKGFSRNRRKRFTKGQPFCVGRGVGLSLSLSLSEPTGKPVGFLMGAVPKTLRIPLGATHLVFA